LHIAYSITHVVLFVVAVTLWFLYFHETLFKTRRVNTHWVKKRLIDLVVVLCIAAITFVFAIFVRGIHVRGR
jgi:hypothetical protein